MIDAATVIDAQINMYSIIEINIKQVLQTLQEEYGQVQGAINWSTVFCLDNQQFINSKFNKTMIKI
jgi:hypothetical protein